MSDPFRVLPDSAASLVCQLSQKSYSQMRLVSPLWRDKVNHHLTCFRPSLLLNCRILTAFRQLELLHLQSRCLNLLEIDQLVSTIRSIKSLKTLCFDFDCSLDEQQARHFFSRLPKVRIEISSLTGGDENMPMILAAKGLKSYQCPPEITDGGIASLAGSQALERICARGPQDRITGCGLYALKTLENLKDLQLSNTQIEGKSLPFLHKLKHLERLNLSHCEKIKSGEFGSLGKVISLIDLNLAATAISDEDLINFCDLKSLQKLVLTLCFRISVVGLKSLEGLKSLRCIECKQLS